jgi:hypothetical protein
MVQTHAGKLSLVLLLFILAAGELGGVAVAQEVKRPHEPVSPKLTPKLQGLLRQEMLSIRKASQDILAALVAGDDARVASLAQQIHDSFILRKSMSPKDRADLRKAVPDDFVQRDKELHAISEKLAQAARAGDRPLQKQLFSRMINACTACHTRYATDRFDGFAK